MEKGIKVDFWAISPRPSYAHQPIQKNGGKIIFEASFLETRCLHNKQEERALKSKCGELLINQATSVYVYRDTVRG